MNNTIFFERFGLNPSNFVNRHYERVKTNKGSIYETEEEYQLRNVLTANTNAWLIKPIYSIGDFY